MINMGSWNVRSLVKLGKQTLQKPLKERIKVIPKKDKPIIYIIALQINKSSHKELSKIAYDTVKDLAARELGLSKDDIKIVRTPFGKPYIDNHEGWHFNVTHTDGLIAIATFGRPIGIDAEKMKQPDLNISKRFFTRREHEYITSSKEEMNKRFFEVWTKKEAYMKCTGEGLHRSLNSFDVFDIESKGMYRHIFFRDYAITVCQNSCEEYDVEMQIIKPL